MKNSLDWRKTGKCLKQHFYITVQCIIATKWIINNKATMKQKSSNKKSFGQPSRSSVLLGFPIDRWGQTGNRGWPRVTAWGGSEPTRTRPRASECSQETRRPEGQNCSSVVSVQYDILCVAPNDAKLPDCFSGWCMTQSHDAHVA